jgi:ABC-type transport system involved in multi-copper enzyme maturation permease subunit
VRESIAAELLVARKRAATWIMLGLWLALGTTFAYIVPYISYRNAAGSPNQDPLTDLLPAHLLGTMLGGFPFFGGAFALMLGVLSLGSEYGWGTLKTLFTQRPGRLRVFGAKLAALGVMLIPFVVLIFGIGVVCSELIARNEHASTTLPSVRLFVEALLGGWLILASWTALGVMLAVLSRGTALAIGVGILYGLVIEGLLSALATQTSLFEPFVKWFLRGSGYSLATGLGASVADAADRGPGSFRGPFISSEQAVLALTAYLVVLLAISAFALRRRDVE